MAKEGQPSGVERAGEKVRNVGLVIAALGLIGMYAHLHFPIFTPEKVTVAGAITTAGGEAVRQVAKGRKK